MNPLCKQINKEKRWLVAASMVLLASVILYIYLVSMTVMHVVVRKEMNKSMAEINSDIAQLEAEYIAAQHAVSAQVATLPGFVESPEKIFIDRSDTVVVVRDSLIP